MKLILTVLIWLSATAVAQINTMDLFHQLDSRLPHGFYRIPSLVTSTNGTLLAFVAGRFHRTDATPNIIYLRRSIDDGKTWFPAQAVLSDLTNRTEYGIVPIVDSHTGIIHLLHNAAHGGCSACTLKVTRSSDHGATWTAPEFLNTTGSPNSTWGGGLASGITISNGQYQGRLVGALRHDCGCKTQRSSFVVFSDDNGNTWSGGQQMVLLPEFGGGWTECQVADLPNGSLIMTSRNFYARSSGQGPRMFARSDDGGATWAANWTAYDLPDPYCEGSLISDIKVQEGALFFGNPSSAGQRRNMSVHVSKDGGRTWPTSYLVYAGGSAYSDMTLTRNGSVAVLFEKDNYNTIAFGIVPNAGAI